MQLLNIRGSVEAVNCTVGTATCATFMLLLRKEAFYLCKAISLAVNFSVMDTFVYTPSKVKRAKVVLCCCFFCLTRTASTWSGGAQSLAADTHRNLRLYRFPRSPWFFRPEHHQSSVLVAILSNFNGYCERKPVFMWAYVVTLHYYYTVVIMILSVDLKNMVIMRSEKYVKKWSLPM